MNIPRATFVLAFSFCLAACGGQQPDANASPSPSATQAQAVEVTVQKAERGTLEITHSSVGTVSSISRTDVAANLSAQIKEMRLWKNAHVIQGQELAVLNPGDLPAQRQQAEAALQEAQLSLQTVQQVNLPQAEAQLKKSLVDAQAAYDNAHSLYTRRQELFAKGGLSERDLEATKLALINAQTALDLAKENMKIQQRAVNPNSVSVARSRVQQARDRIAMLDTQMTQTVVRAPISGTVVEQYLYAGDFAGQGSKLLTIADERALVVKASVPDNLASQLAEGQPVLLVPQADPGKKYSGAISLISRSTNLSNRTVEVWSRLSTPEPAFKVGDAVKVEILKKNPPAILVPNSAVTLDSPGASTGVVDVVQSDIVKQTEVHVGASNDSEMEILKGLSGNEWVVVEGNYRLPDGSKVVVKERRTALEHQ